MQSLSMCILITLAKKEETLVIDALNTYKDHECTFILDYDVFFVSNLPQ